MFATSRPMGFPRAELGPARSHSRGRGRHHVRHLRQRRLRARRPHRPRDLALLAPRHRRTDRRRFSAPQSRRRSLALRVFMETDNAHLFVSTLAPAIFFGTCPTPKATKTTAPPARLWSSKTKSSSAPPAATTAFAVSSPPSTPKPAKKPGVSGPSPAPANSAPLAGPAIFTARRRHHLDARHLRSRSQYDLSGAPAIPPPISTAGRAPATIFTPIASSRSIQTPARLKWYFQFTPHDLFDYDATETPVLVDATLIRASRESYLLEANRNGFLLRPRSHQRKVSLGRSLCRRETQLGQRHRREGSSHSHRRRAHRQRHGDLPRHDWRHELVFAFLQSDHPSFYFMALEELRSLFSQTEDLRSGHTYYCNRRSSQ